MNISNQIFNKICVALGLRSDDKREWLDLSGIPVSKSKVQSWSTSGKNYDPMPDDDLDLFLDYVSTRNGIHPLISWIAGELSGREYQREGIALLDALSELITLSRREYGYTPCNLKAQIRLSGLTRKQFAEKNGLKQRAVDTWCLPYSSNEHRDMPGESWEQIIAQMTG